MANLPAKTLRRAVTEQLSPAPLASGQGGAGEAHVGPYSLPAEGTGARIAWQVNITGAPTAVSVPLLGSLDGINFYQIDVSTSLTGELRVVADLAVSQIMVGAISFTGGTSPTATVFARTQ